MDQPSGKLVTLLEGVGEIGDITYDAASQRLFVTGHDGVAIFQQMDADHYRLVCRFNTMGGMRSVYVPAKKLFYVIHGKNAEDGAALQVYEVKE